MKLTDVDVLRRLLGDNDFTFRKSLGQNFLIDDTVCPRMADAACAPDTGVLEIGPGVGVLTVELAARARRVVALELDTRLQPILARTLADCPNASVVFGDAMKLDLRALLADAFADCARVTVCANLPYYITSPLLLRLLEERLPVASITVLVQREAAERLAAPVGTRAAGAVSVAVEYYSAPSLLFPVSRTAFLPQPKVDSAVLHLAVREKPPVELKDEAHFFALVKAGFAQRRKTLCNALSGALGLEKAQVAAALDALGLPPTARIEQLSLAELAALDDRLSAPPA